MSVAYSNNEIILASASIIRQQLLRNTGIEFRIIKADIDEDKFKTSVKNTHAQAVATAMHIASEKACYVSRSYPDAYVIGADQILHFNDHIYSKPQSLTELKQRLCDMRGRSHHLINGCIVAKKGQKMWGYDGITKLTMRSFSDAFIESYVEQHAHIATSTVGGYDIEGLGIHLFKTIEGDYFNIMGLPLLSLLDYFRQEKILIS